MKVYEVELGGIKHTMQLSDEDAARYGNAVEVKAKAAKPANKAAKPGAKSEADEVL